MNNDGSAGQVRRLQVGVASDAHGAVLPRVLPAVLSAAVVTLLGLMAVVHPAARRPVVSVVSIVMMIAVVTVTAGLLRLPRLAAQERRAWRTLLVAFSIFLTAPLFGLAVQIPVLAPQWPALAQLREVALISGFAAMVTALYRFPAAPRHNLPRARFALDGATIFLASSLFLWHFLIAPEMARDAISVRTAVFVVVVVGLLAMFVGAMGLLLLQERGPATREVLIRLALGVGLLLVGALITVARGVDAGRVPALWSMALNWTALILVLSAAVRQHRHVLLREHQETESVPGSFAALPYLAVSLVFGLLLWVGLSEAPLKLKGVLVGAAVVGACVLLRQWLLLAENERLRVELEVQATRDPLTGLHNRRSWESYAELQVEQALRHGRDLAVLVVDLDGFKQINDAHGHAVGDEVLQGVARCLESSLRAADLVGRIGGDEFVVLLPETAVSDAGLLAETLCLKLSRIRSDVDGHTLRVTASIGAAAMPPASSLRELVTQADAAMYQAKRQGRNRVRTAAAHVRALSSHEAAGS